MMIDAAFFLCPAGMGVSEWRSEGGRGCLEGGNGDGSRLSRLRGGRPERQAAPPDLPRWPAHGPAVL
eukprot:4996618-Prymnesium_polylepis.1